MKRNLFIFTVFCSAIFGAGVEAVAQNSSAVSTTFVKDAASFGFLPENDGLKNAAALQKAVDGGGTIVVSKAGTYALSKTVMLDDHTRLIFGGNVFVKKKASPDKFAYVFVNRGAYKKQWNEDIEIEGLNLSVNGVDSRGGDVIGLIGQVSFFYVKDLHIKRFRCYDLESSQFCIQICTFENAAVDDVVIYGKKDGVHFGRGKIFRVSNGVFRTFDDAIALNAHDYSTSNPELGWIEDGVIENIVDLDDVSTTGYFCRILAGAWCEWREGMEIRRSDSAVSNGRVYRSVNPPDGAKFVSKTRPTHEKGVVELDGIKWAMVQEGSVYDAGVRNAVFRDIYIYKRRTAFSVHFDNDRYSRSFHPDAAKVSQSNIVFDNVQILHGDPKPFLTTYTPIDVMVLKNCSLRNNQIIFRSNSDIKDFGKTFIRMMGCTLNMSKKMPLVVNKIPQKEIDFYSAGTAVLGETPLAPENSGKGKFDCDFLTK